MTESETDALGADQVDSGKVDAQVQHSLTICLRFSCAYHCDLPWHAVLPAYLEILRQTKPVTSSVYTCRLQSAVIRAAVKPLVDCDFGW